MLIPRWKIEVCGIGGVPAIVVLQVPAVDRVHGSRQFHEIRKTSFCIAWNITAANALGEVVDGGIGHIMKQR